MKLWFDQMSDGNQHITFREAMSYKDFNGWIKEDLITEAIIRDIWNIYRAQKGIEYVGFNQFVEILVVIPADVKDEELALYTRLQELSLTDL